MRRAALLSFSPLLISAADPVGEAQRAASAAAREQARLEQAAAQARTEADRLRASQEAAAAAIIASESRVDAAEAEIAALERQLAERQARLAQERRPTALLLGGVAQMGRRPPLLALADQGSADDFVRVRALLATTMPVIEARTAALRQEVAQVQRLAAAAQAKLTQLASEQSSLQQARQRFAALEREALVRSSALDGQALTAADVALGQAEQAARLGSQVQQQAAADRLARRLADLPEAAPRPNAPDGPARTAELSWRLPLDGRITAGLFEVSDNGVRSRGLTIAANSGTSITAPAPGRIVFAGPFRRRDGVLIIDHGRGWMTLMTEVRPTLTVGTQVQAGDPVGRALGPVTVELTRNGTPVPAALIARSSPLLSNGGKSG